MKAVIEKRLETDTVNVWILSDHPSQRQVLVLGATEPFGHWETVVPGASISPTYVFGSEVIAAIAREAGNVVDSTNETREALIDARQVRDRLLTMIEEKQ